MNEEPLEGLDHKNLREIIIKYHSNHRRQRYELVDEPKKQSNRIFIDGKLALKVIVGCTISAVQEFRIRPGLKKYDVILTKEQSVLTTTKSSFE